MPNPWLRSPALHARQRPRQSLHVDGVKAFHALSLCVGSTALFRGLTPEKVLLNVGSLQHLMSPICPVPISFHGVKHRPSFQDEQFTALVIKGCFSSHRLRRSWTRFRSYAALCTRLASLHVRMTLSPGCGVATSHDRIRTMRLAATKGAAGVGAKSIAESLPNPSKLSKVMKPKAGQTRVRVLWSDHEIQRTVKINPNKKCVPPASAKHAAMQCCRFHRKWSPK